MMSKNKYPEIAMPRMAAMYIAFKHGYTYSGIARQFNRTAGTVTNAIKSVQNEADTRPKFAAIIKLIEKKIENEQH
jgi:chromosomal replication initiation ATPase DnaA